MKFLINLVWDVHSLTHSVHSLTLYTHSLCTLREISFFLNIFYVYNPIELKISLVVKHIETQLFYCQSLTQSFTQSGKLGN